MKTRILPILAAALIAATNSLVAQGPVNTGLVQKLSKEQGTLTLRTEQSGGGSIVYHGMDKAEILTVGGKPAGLADISLGQRVSVFYKKSGDQWLVSRVLIPEPAPATATATATTAPAATTVAPAATSRAATDGDITTQPAKNAATDGDRTTRAPNTAATDGDRTTRPPNSAATDGDRTTVPADGPRSGLRRNSAGGVK
jgi:hypothetical protein